MDKIHKSMRPTYWRWKHILRPLFNFYCKQQVQNIAESRFDNRFYMQVY